VVLDAGARKELKRIALGGGAAGILMQPNGTKAYVAVGSKNGVAVIDLKSLEPAGHIETGPGPDGLSWAVNIDRHPEPILPQPRSTQNIWAPRELPVSLPWRCPIGAFDLTSPRLIARGRHQHFGRAPYGPAEDFHQLCSRRSPAR
jgi:hypothetical protein